MKMFMPPQQSPPSDQPTILQTAINSFINQLGTCRRAFVLVKWVSFSSQFSFFVERAASPNAPFWPSNHLADHNSFINQLATVGESLCSGQKGEFWPIIILFCWAAWTFSIDIFPVHHHLHKDIIVSKSSSPDSATVPPIKTIYVVLQHFE